MYVQKSKFLFFNKIHMSAKNKWNIKLDDKAAIYNHTVDFTNTDFGFK